MIAVPSSVLVGLEEEGTSLRFTKDIWNKCQAVRQETKGSSVTFKEAGNKNCRPTTIETNDGLAIKVPERPPTQPKQCKVKVVRFQYGGR